MVSIWCRSAVDLVSIWMSPRSLGVCWAPLGVSWVYPGLSWVSPGVPWASIWVDLLLIWGRSGIDLVSICGRSMGKRHIHCFYTCLRPGCLPGLRVFGVGLLLIWCRSGVDLWSIYAQRPLCPVFIHACGGLCATRLQ